MSRSIFLIVSVAVLSGCHYQRGFYSGKSSAEYQEGWWLGYNSAKGRHYVKENSELKDKIRELEMDNAALKAANQHLLEQEHGK